MAEVWEANLISATLQKLLVPYIRPPFIFPLYFHFLSPKGKKIHVVSGDEQLPDQREQGKKLLQLSLTIALLD